MRGAVSYSVWAPITISSLLGAQQAPVQTSSDVSGPVEIPIGGQVASKCRMSGTARIS